MGNSQSAPNQVHTAQTGLKLNHRRERSTSTRDPSTTDSPVAEGEPVSRHGSHRRAGHGASISSQTHSITRKGSGDTTSTLDPLADKIELLQEAGSSLPQDVSRRISLVSAVDHLDDDDVLNPHGISSLPKTDQEEIRKVDVDIHWTGKAEHVYVTGSFTRWRKKVQLSAIAGLSENFSVTLSLPPGTHRLKFDVDGQWRLSDDLAVATDSSGNFVNYIDVPQQDDLELTRTFSKQGDPRDDGASDSPECEQSLKWTSAIPAFLHAADDETAMEGDHATIRSIRRELVAPALPPHLEKVILNTSNEKKDDHSVLPQPNHVVLNHLAASSIRNGVLAVSASTRYRRKYVTTIMYRPASTTTA
ncbi:galactose metabolism-related protein [Savitreella phatthalungensis]